MVTLERPLPAALPTGTTTAVFCLGTCHHTEEEIERLWVLVDGRCHEPSAFGMPRPDVAAREPRARYGGFWATVPVRAPDQPGSVLLEVRARLRGGTEVDHPLGCIDAVDAPRPAAAPLPARPGPAPGLITICMATFEPDLELFRVQVQSIRDQTDDRWVCVISDDCSDPVHLQGVEEVLDADPRFVISRSEDRLGFYRNFERALRMAPPDTELVALCDQDDRWHPDKLAVLRAALGDALLVFSDQRLVDDRGRVLRETLWQGRRNNSEDLASMLVANTITGAATLFRRELADLALPFPDSPGFQFHDHWLGVVALAAGEIAYVDRPLYDYVQHRGAVFGHVSSGSPAGERLRRLGSPSAAARDVVLASRAAYFYGYLARTVQAETALLRCNDRVTPPKRRSLERFIAAERSVAAFAWLALRPLRELVGHNETLGSEAALARGVAWKTATAARAHGRPLRRWAGDASFPPPGSFNQKRLRRWRGRMR